MKNKKGFTLIELLAVIVILAIIALIATPIILNMIEESRKGAATDSAYGYLKAIDYQNSMSMLNESKYPLYETGNYSVAELNLTNVKGTKPTSGIVYIENKVITKAELCIDGYKVIYETNKVTQVTKSSECVSNKETNDNPSTENGNNSGTNTGDSSTDSGNNSGTESDEPVVKNYVAQISTTKYETVQEAVNAIPTNNTETTLLLLENVTENVNVAENQNVVFDLNGKKITGIVVNKGSINVKNGEITNSASNSILNYGKVALNGATISNSSSYGSISNRKELIINSGTVLGVVSNAITNYDGATVILNNGSILSTNNASILNSGEVTMLNGKMESLKVTVNNKATGILNISGGTLSLNSVNEANIIVNKGKVNISGTATLTGIATSVSTISNQTGGILNISGGTITSKHTNVLVCYDGAEINITGGTLKGSGTYRTLYVNAGGKVNISDGTLIAENGGVIKNESGSNVTITGGMFKTINASTASNVLRNEGTCKITNGVFYGVATEIATMHNIGTMTIENGTFTSESSGSMAMYNNGNLTITGGTFTSARNSIYNEVYYDGVISVSGAVANGPTYGY